jgi:hypothetical protein
MMKQLLSCDSLDRQLDILNDIDLQLTKHCIALDNDTVLRTVQQLVELGEAGRPELQAPMEHIFSLLRQSHPKAFNQAMENQFSDAMLKATERHTSSITEEETPKSDVTTDMDGSESPEYPNTDAMMTSFLKDGLESMVDKSVVSITNDISSPTKANMSHDEILDELHDLMMDDKRESYNKQDTMGRHRFVVSHLMIIHIVVLSHRLLPRHIDLCSILRLTQTMP